MELIRCILTIYRALPISGIIQQTTDQKTGFDIACQNNLHEISKPVFRKIRKKKHFNMSSAENFTQAFTEALDGGITIK